MKWVSSLKVLQSTFTQYFFAWKIVTQQGAPATRNSPTLWLHFILGLHWKDKCMMLKKRTHLLTYWCIRHDDHAVGIGSEGVYESCKIWVPNLHALEVCCQLAVEDEKANKVIQLKGIGIPFQKVYWSMNHDTIKLSAEGGNKYWQNTLDYKYFYIHSSWGKQTKQSLKLWTLSKMCKWQ